MIGIAPTATPPLLRLDGSTSARGWQLGQILQATVLSSRADNALLHIGDRTVSASTPRNLTPGQALRLEVTALAPRTTLKLLEPAAEPTLLQASRTLLPRQAPSTLLVQSLQQPGVAERLPPPVRQAAEALLSSIPRGTDLADGDRLRQALSSSGLLFESKVSRIMAGGASAGMPGDDLKGLLAGMLRQLFRHLPDTPRSREGGGHPPPSRLGPSAPVTTPPDPPATDTGKLLGILARQADGALARIQLTQVNLLAADGQLPWLFELPVRHGDRAELVQLWLDRESQGDAREQQEKSWVVRIRMDCTELGPLHCTVTLRGKSVSTRWWAEHDGTAERVETALDTLRQRLGELGLAVGGMRCSAGRPPEPPSDNGPPGGLLDAKA